jgi:membrane-associated phospholipid phosphatase
LGNAAGTLLMYRAAFSLLLFCIVRISEIYDYRFVQFVRYVFPFALIVYWYPETYALGGNTDGVLPQSAFASNLDDFFARLDLTIFGCSPSIEFSKAIPQTAVAELMYFGYFAYYLIFAGMFTYLFYVRSSVAERAMFYVLCSFFIFYIIFVFVPVAGPQFYYPHPEGRTPDGYIFGSLMHLLQSMGEKPTGAFPSSHVGMTFIAMMLLYRHGRKYFYITLPVAIVLVASTVYIKAHYLVDVVAAFIVAPLIFILSRWIFGLFKRRDGGGGGGGAVKSPDHNS